MFTYVRYCLFCFLPHVNLPHCVQYAFVQGTKKSVFAFSCVFIVFASFRIPFRFKFSKPGLTPRPLILVRGTSCTWMMICRICETNRSSERLASAEKDCEAMK